MAFWRKVVGKTSSPQSTSLLKSQSCPGLKGGGAQSPENGGGEEPSSGPLAAFLEEYERSLEEEHHESWDTLLQKTSRLSKTIQDFLSDAGSLVYLAQYLEHQGADHLLKFHLDVDSFRNSGIPSIHPGLDRCNDRGRLQRVPEDGSQGTLENDLPSSPTSLDTIEGSSSTCESAESVDSGYAKSEHDAFKDCRQDTDSIHSGDMSESLDNQEPVLDKESSRGDTLLRSRTRDAVNIYRRYIAPDSGAPINLQMELKKDIVELICDESGLVSPQCFDSAQMEVLRILDSEYFPGFLESEFHTRHQVELLSGDTVSVFDILFNEVALFHFMEFLEGEGQRPVVEFWMAAVNFQQSLDRNEEVDEGMKTHDAMILYDKFISMQASTPLGVNSRVRLQIENNICQENGPRPSCFASALEIIVVFFERKYLEKFLESKVFQNYLKELVSSIQTSTRALSSVHRAPSNESLSSCSSDATSKFSDATSRFGDVTSRFSDATSRLAHSGPVRNTLLATGDKLVAPTERLENLQIDCGFLTDPDSIWRRKPNRCTVGKIDYLGRYHSSWEQPPGVVKELGLLGKVRRLGRGDQRKLQEEMAWQVAEMFVRDVMSVTMAEDNIPEDKPPPEQNQIS